MRCEDTTDVRTKLSTLVTVVRPKARHNHPMTVRCFETADGRTGEQGQFGRFPEVDDLFDIRLDAPRAVHEATLPVAFER